MSQTAQTVPVSDEDADGYYGDDDATDEELDLSFLDQEDEDETESE